MRRTYGIMDERIVLLYKPQLFLKNKDLLIFSTADFQKWHDDIKEYIDALYQIDCWEMEKGNSIGITELKMAMGLVNNIAEEVEHLFDPEKSPDSPEHYISTLDRKYKRQRSKITSDMRRIDIRIPAVTMEIKHKNMMEIVYEAGRDFQMPKRRKKALKMDRTGKEDINDII